MNITEIISDAIRYPFSDITKFLMVGVLVVLAGLSSVTTTWGIDNSIIGLIVAIISIIFALVLSGFSVDVIKKGIQNSDEIPNIDLMRNLINGIKVLIISIVYYIIPLIIILILAVITGAIGAGLDQIVAAMGVTAIIAIIIFILFAIFEIVAIARFAETEDLGAALSIGEVIGDAQKIGIFKIIAFIIIALIIIFLAVVISSILAIIPFIGILITMIVIGGFVVLFYNKGIGLLYADA